MIRRTYFEMSDKKDKFQDNIKYQHMGAIMTHFLKLRLTTSWGNNINHNMWLFVKGYENDWINQLRRQIKTMFRYINGVKVDGGRKDKLYKEALHDFYMQGTLTLLNKVSEGFDKSPYKVKWKDILSNYLSEDELDKESWFNKIYDFLMSLSPIRNNTITPEEAVERFNLWISDWLLNN